MVNQAAQRLAWNDRWTQPTLEQLLSPLKMHHRRTLQYVMDGLAELEGVNQSILWYGEAWKWTIHYPLPAHPVPKGSKVVAEESSLCYLVPRVEGPMVCVPLSDAVLGQIPVARLNKFVRDGIKLAKWAVAIHWATWTPATQAEALQIIDLLKRRHKLAMAAQAQPAAAAAPASRR
ncbi:MAG: hypothetical protein NTW19_25230 [Planctomycetota bacterium]|nr:hypothetical protein [Planctomycetota bacterium]